MSSYRSPIHKLAPETLSVIFELVCSTFNFAEVVKHYDSGPHPEQPGAHFTLAAVCSHWRCTVWSTPRLWTYLCFNVDEKYPAASRNNYLKLYELYLFNSGSVGVSIEIILPKKWQWDQTERSWLLDGILGGGLQNQIRSLVLVNPDILVLEHVARGFSNLQNLAILVSPDAVIDWPFRLRFTNAIRLNNFVLRTPKSNIDLELPWKTITRLDLGEVPPRCCIKVLRLCQELVEFSAYSLAPRRLREDGTEQGVGESQGGEASRHGDENEFQHYSGGILTLPNLKSFDWPCYEGTPINKFLMHVRMPMLETLKLHYSRPFGGEPWEVFFSHLPMSFKKLELHDFYYSSTARYRGEELDIPGWFFRNAPQVEELRLRWCRRGLLGVLFNALKSRIDRKNGKGSGGEEWCPEFLVGLRTVRLSSLSFPGSSQGLEEARDMLLNMAKWRFWGYEKIPRVVTWEDKEEMDVVLNIVWD